MRFISLIVVAGLAVLAGACTTDTTGYGPYYGPAQGYAPAPGYGYYGPRPYYNPPPYGYGAPYGGGYGSGPSITFTLPSG